MYSYVTVGEFIAFVIGWNMVLEYLIGTAACSCALSACLDVLANGRITNSTAEIFGTMFGKETYVFMRNARKIFYKSFEVTSSPAHVFTTRVVNIFANCIYYLRPKTIVR